MRTYSAKPADVQRKWFVIDADGVVLGRMAAIVAQILRGKHKTIYTPHIDTGDHVVIVNAEKVKLTGRKADQRIFYWHSGHPGGLKEHTPRRTLAGRFPERVVKRAIERMMPKDSPLSRAQLKKLKVYAGAEHPHEAQSPEVMDLGSRNRKNKP
ncbi:MAG: 50S ribosomal protein L13 [Candidatus Marinimicrobia bacterium]|nr:50S ribosomal protein L13 [Candidatus Neomarinimicrobiota bacterium]